MSSTPETSVIVLNWNGARLLPECLSALAAQTYTDFELFLVDNGSIDASRLLLNDLSHTEQPVKNVWPGLPSEYIGERATRKIPPGLATPRIVEAAPQSPAHDWS